jgi:hypothetical protein
MMNQPPDKIYLQYYSDDNLDGAKPVDHRDVTWSIDKINDDDVVYVREKEIILNEELLTSGF